MAKREKRPRVAHREDSPRRDRSRPRTDSLASDSTAKNNPAIIAVALAIIARVLMALYVPASDAPLVYDDSNSITHNPSITRLWPLWGDAQRPAR